MIAFILELIIAFVVAGFVVSKFGWITGIIVFFVLMGITNSALSKKR